ncbi:universal stress protein [Halalkalicoccus ordinarius]|uniref:universal stress protein n=1 Tax=Halalkalicoccus ordinarius TaxID=3116651 RepID=UPI00300EC5D2
MAETILVPVDDSERSTEALEFALENDPDARFVVIHVHEPVYGESLAGQEIETERTGADELFEQARGLAEERGVELETVTAEGTPSAAIVEYAENNPVEKIVMGSHGREGASRVLLGSVAENVTRRSPVPVTVVR